MLQTKQKLFHLYPAPSSEMLTSIQFTNTHLTFYSLKVVPHPLSGLFLLTAEQILLTLPILQIGKQAQEG